MIMSGYGVSHQRKLSASLIVLASLTASLLSAPGSMAANENPETVAPAGNVSSQFIETLGSKVIDNEQKLMEYKGWILEQKEVEAAGYIDQVNDAEAMAVTLLWAQPSPLQDAVVQEGFRRGIRVNIESRPLSILEIRNITEKIASQKEVLKLSGFDLALIAGVQKDVPLISVEGQYTSPVTPEIAKAIRAVIVEIAGTDLIEVVETGVVAPAATRTTDTPPFWAGGSMRGPHCSSGFGVNLSGIFRVTTARHCNSGVYYAWDLPSSRYGGTHVWSSAEGGARVLQGGANGRMFDGAWNNTTGYTKRVAGYSDVGIGSRICVSGANSGVHCNIAVTQMSVYWTDQYGGMYTIRGHQQTAGQIAVMAGDSGGPVFFPFSNGGDVGAAGMVQASVGADYVDCPSSRVREVCAPELLFSSTRTINNSLGGGLVTG